MTETNEDRIGTWMQTWTGKKFYHLDPRPEDIDLLDIFHALGNMSRYNGHCRFYSVAEHSVLVSKLVPKEHALVALCHDFSEAYIMDVSRPLKRSLGADCSYFEIEQNIWEKAIAPKLNLPLEMPKCVHDADTQILVLERAALHPRADDWSIPFDMPTGVSIVGHHPWEATNLLIERFYELTLTDHRPMASRFANMCLEDLYTFIKNAPNNVA